MTTTTTYVDSKPGTTQIGFGPAQVDWEGRLNWAKLREDRLRKTKEAMAAHGVQYLLQLRAENARYSTGIKRLYWPTIQLGGGPLIVHTLEGDPAVWVIDPEFACKAL